METQGAADPLFSVAGKRILVTGASSGLGDHFARMLAARGARVVLAARSLDKVEASAAEIGASGGRAEARRLDVADPESVTAFFAALTEPLDVVINNAGISGSGSALAMGPAEFDEVLRTNLTGVYQVAQEAARQWSVAKRPGSIVNIASILGLRVAGHVPAYTASKAAVIQLTKSLALEWARYRIRVNALCPGYIETPINRDFLHSPSGQEMIKRIPQRRVGLPSDLDGPLCLLCADGSGYMTGSVIAVDGGHLVSTL